MLDLAENRARNAAANARWFPGTEGDPRTAYRNLVRERCGAGYRVVDLGAGPVDALSTWIRNGSEAPSDVQVVSVDVDADELGANPNPFRLMASGETLPVRSGTVDLVISRYVVEHLEEPDAVLREVARVLRPGGAFVFATPHALYYVSLAARLTPVSVHERVRRLMGQPPGHIHVFPTRYRMNTPWAIARRARRAGLRVASLDTVAGPPAYTVFLPPPLHLLFVAYHRVLAGSAQLRRVLGVSLLGVLVKDARAGPTGSGSA